MSRERLTLSPNVVALGLVSLLMGISSAMIHGLLPVFLVQVLGAGMIVVGAIEGTAEGMVSFAKILSGIASDWSGRRKWLVLLGYGLSATNKILFPLAGTALVVLVARVIDRLGKGIRDAPRDALIADVTPSAIRGTGFGLRLSLYTVGAVLGPLCAIGLMFLSGDDFRFVFWMATIPAFLSVIVLARNVREPPEHYAQRKYRFSIRVHDLIHLGTPFWWAVSISATLSLARFSQAFLLLKSHDIGTDAGLVPVILVVMNLVFSISAYPFGILADRIDRSAQLALGALVLVAADLVLVMGSTIWTVALGGALWGLQAGVTQGLLAASVADAAPVHLRGTAFGTYELIVGIATFFASVGAGALWAAAGPRATFSTGACIAATAIILIAIRTTSLKSTNPSP